jgi:IS30 family transposase
LRELVIDRLKAYWSPEQIAGRLAEDAANPVRICPETIYRFVYCKEDYGLGLYRYLPEARRKRRLSRLSPTARQRLPGRLQDISKT